MYLLLKGAVGVDTYVYITKLYAESFTIHIQIHQAHTLVYELID